MPATVTREAFERQKAAYEQNALQMRALNEQMTRVPTLSITLTGGLWFVASQAPSIDLVTKFGLLLFACVANIGLALSCYRIRDVMQSYLEKMEEFAPKSFVNGRPREPVLGRLSHYSMITIYVALMAVAAMMSFAGAFYSYWPFAPEYLWHGVLIVFLFLFLGLSGILSGWR